MLSQLNAYRPYVMSDQLITLNRDAARLGAFSGVLKPRTAAARAHSSRPCTLKTGPGPGPGPGRGWLEPACVSWANSGVSTCGLETQVAQARRSPSSDGTLALTPLPPSPPFGPREVTTPPQRLRLNFKNSPRSHTGHKQTPHLR